MLSQKTFRLIGNPVCHSFSPIMHNALYKELGLPWKYELCECLNENDVMHQLQLLKSNKIAGLNVTYPYKQIVLSSVQNLKKSALCASAANVLYMQGEKLVAHNTDGAGALAAVKRLCRADLKDASCAIFGTGATARAIALAVLEEKVKQITIFSRSTQRAKTCVHEISKYFPGYKSLLRAADYSEANDVIPVQNIIINATPLGMSATKEQCAISPSCLRPHHYVMDVVYASQKTMLLKAAELVGARYMDGTEMLVQQAALTIELWRDAFGLDFEVSREILRNALKKAQKRA